MARRRIIPIYVADFETTGEKQFKIEGRTRVYLWNLKSLNGKISEYGISLDEFFNTINQLDDSLIYFHNLSFDGSFLLWYLMEHSYLYTERCDTIRDERTFEVLIDDGNIFYSMKIITSLGNCIEIRCSYKLLPYSIAKIGTLVGVKKLSETHDYLEVKNYKTLDEVPEEEIKYIDGDTEIMRLALIKLYELGVKEITISTSAYKSWRSDKYMFTLSNLIRPDDERINEIVEKSYRGGMTKVNEKYRNKELKNVISLDVNSLYPSVMLENSMPVGQGKLFTTLEQCENEGYKKQIIVIYVDDVKVVDGFHSFIGLFRGFSYGSYKYNDVIQDTYLYLWRDEYELFKMVYEGDFHIFEIVGFKKYEWVFKTYIEKWYHIKEIATNEVERNLAKLMLNSLYGKFGMNDLRTSKIPISIEDDKMIFENDEHTTVYYYKPIASYITSMARVKTATAIQLCKDRFVYCDTDSIYLIGSKIPNNIEVHATKLGAWGYEGHYKRFKCLKAKCYLKELDDGKMVSSIAGLPLDARDKVNFENFEVGLTLKGVKRSKMLVKGGTIITNIDFSIRAS